MAGSVDDRLAVWQGKGVWRPVWHAGGSAGGGNVWAPLRQAVWPDPSTGHRPPTGQMEVQQQPMVMHNFTWQPKQADTIRHMLLALEPSG